MNAPLSPYEERLLREAAAWPELTRWKDLTADVLRDLAADRGADFATAVLYQRLIHSPEHGPFFERVQAPSRDHQQPCLRDGAVAVVPGACYREFPRTGADGRRLQDVAADCGWKVATIPVASFGALAENARTVSKWLDEHSEEPIVLVSLSKGGADVKTALAQPELALAMRNVVVWISLSGILHGTPLADWFLKTPWRRALVRFLCWRHGFNYSDFQELAHGDSGALAASLAAPPWLSIVHVVGFPLIRHLGNRRSRRSYRRLAKLGPSDGGGILLGDVCRWPGVIYPVWGADHYLNPAWDIRPLVRRILFTALEDSNCRGGLVVNAQGERL